MGERWAAPQPPPPWGHGADKGDLRVGGGAKEEGEGEEVVQAHIGVDQEDRPACHPVGARLGR